MTIDEIERELHEITLQFAKSNGDEEKLFLAPEDLRAVTARVTALMKPVYDKINAEAADARREFDAQVILDRETLPALTLVAPLGRGGRGT